MNEKKNIIKYSSFRPKYFENGIFMTSPPTECGIDYMVMGPPFGDPLVLIMGWKCSYLLWPQDFLSQLISTNSYRIILFNNRGINHPPGCAETEYTFELLSKDIDELILFLKKKNIILSLKKPTMLGWSFGAMVAIYYCMTRSGKCLKCISICGGLEDIGNTPLDFNSPEDIVNKLFIPEDPYFPIYDCLFSNGQSVSIYEQTMHTFQGMISLFLLGQWQYKAMKEYRSFILGYDFKSKPLPYLIFITGKYDKMVPPDRNILFLQKNWKPYLLQLYSFLEGHGLMYILPSTIIDIIGK